MLKALLTRLWWERVTPLGLPVVPEVNWMLQASSILILSVRSATILVAPDPPLLITSLNLIVPGFDTSEMRIMLRRLGTSLLLKDTPLLDSNSGITWQRSLW